jgi:hypothetical protein
MGLSHALVWKGKTIAKMHGDNHRTMVVVTEEAV